MSQNDTNTGRAALNILKTIDINMVNVLINRTEAH